MAAFTVQNAFEASYDGRWDSQQSGSDMLVQAVGFGRATFMPISWAYFNPVLDLSSAPDITVSGTFELAGRWQGDHHDGVPIFVLTHRVEEGDVPPGSARVVRPHL